ncbi:MAG: hypothetical protein Q9185_000314 [Variospora sp. 1 TL-2023]
MALLSAGFPALDPEVVSLYCTRDPLLENLPVLIFYGPSTTSNATRSSTRVQAHIYSLAGFQSFPRLTIAPTSPLYAAVHHLPSDKQGDEVYRGLAVSLLSYFAGLSRSVKEITKELAGRRRANRVAPTIFDEIHAGELASNLVKLDNVGEMVRLLSSVLRPQCLSWIDVDVVLPAQTIQRAVTQDGPDIVPAVGDDGLPLYHYSKYGSLIDQLGHPAFLPTSKLRRAPSRPTAHSKSRSLSKEQKIAIRREMCELLDTEKRYVAKLHNLVDEIAVDFRQSVQVDTSNGSLRLGKDAVGQLFPGSLSNILAANDGFLAELEDVLSTTEDEAIQDIEDLAGDLAKLQLESVNATTRRRDPTGTLAFAKTFLTWLPKFTDPYQDYMRMNAGLSEALHAAHNVDTPALSQILFNFGEQRLRSMLIEPVQRLPRYSLLLDNIISQLPASHPAMSGLLKSKDMLADICALDNSGSADSAKASSTIRKFLGQWPSWLSPRGRLITAIDAVDLHPPYSNLSLGQDVVLLLFPDTLIIAQKQHSNALSAKGIITEVDRSVMTPVQQPTTGNGLLFGAAFDLSKLRISESPDGRVVRLTHVAAGTSYLQGFPSTPGSASANVNVKVLLLLGPYEAKAHRLSEDVTKARIEGRFSEPIRESDKWALHTIATVPGSLGLITAIYEETAVSKMNSIQTACRFRVEVDSQGDLLESRSRHTGVEIAAQIIPLGTDRFRLEVQGDQGKRWSETSVCQNLGNVLVNIIMQVINAQAQEESQPSALSQLSFHREVVHALHIPQISDPSESRSLKPLSPIKLVSNLFSGSHNLPGTPYKWKSQAPEIKEIPPIPPPKSFKSASENQPGASEGDKVTLIGAKQDIVSNPFEWLELTYNAYVLALRSRSGNVVGRTLRNRAAADELEVNELYNALLEDPSHMQAAAEVAVDVLFAAFEKFLSKAWRDRMGNMLTPDFLATMTSGLDSGKPTVFLQQVRTCLADMSPQNRRAFSSAIKLLSDLLEASGNDGDRGVLMASFTEALISDGNPHDYITLFDRLVDDYDNMFDESAATRSELTAGASSAAGSLDRNRSANTGSLSSNASSLRKRFGFGSLSRENSKSESETKVTSVWRTLSKNAKLPGDGQQKPASLSKASLIRSRSTDTVPLALPQFRPSSRDRPTPPSASPREGSNSRPTSSHLNMTMLSTIGENTPTKNPSALRKKRRSSLSDLRFAQQPPTVAAWQPLQPRKLPQPVTKMGVSPRTPSHNKVSQRKTPSVDLTLRFPSPEKFGSRRGSPDRFASPPRKENSPLQARPTENESSPSVPRYNYKKPTAPTENSNVTIKGLSPKKRTPSSTGIPAPRGGLTERAWPPNAPANTTSSSKAPQIPRQKLRMQSPQKLRERLSNEQKALSGAESNLRAEIAKIGEEMSAFRLSRPDADNTASSDPFSDVSMASLDARLTSLATTLSTLASTVRTQYSNLSKDVDSSLLASERKARKLDELYKEANAENEALYERFNDELSKVLKAVKGGEGAEELRRKVKEGAEEAGRLRRENGRLKREVVGLRSQVGGP